MALCHHGKSTRVIIVLATKQPKQTLAGLDKIKANKQLELSHRELQLMVRILTGHCLLHKHPSKIGDKKYLIFPMWGLEQ